MDFVPHTRKDIEGMLKEVGVNSLDDLFRDIPDNIKIKGGLKIPASLDEKSVSDLVGGLSKKNVNSKQYVSFLGGGCYNHFIPSAVAHLVYRSEFYTAYTPYQPEMSQGILQAIFEFQTYMARLTGMDLANASMYCGASALAEAMMMAKNHTNRKKIVISKAVNPEYRQVVQTYATANELEVVEIKVGNDLATDFSEAVDDKTACVIVQYPNFFGTIEDLEKISALAHSKGAVAIASVQEMYSLGMLRPPGELGMDIAACEAQSFGNPISFGGPHLGVIACKTDLMRRIPGRLVGKTTDSEGKEGYILTLQAREQHIRREKASSNICSNEALCALAATIHLSMLGKSGLQKASEICAKNATYAKKRFEGLKLHLLNQNIYNEFCVEIPNADKVFEKLVEKKFIPGIKLWKYYPEMKNGLLISFTEMNTKKEMDEFFSALEGSL
ncbi:glycine dehydrogenase (decarboxylating) subunit 1 [Candidatus Bilamarchaeum dharawalense]|uniref:Probable glycine dehydrogenase (decarboxylating) subunit 1 n=1 Tax=Candidatus Bilamarchaeum dharawalense TaxID=2885759 RepID=A0A5E4LUQ6_9ARCH|nr:glycine dehydrogenase (decarboxylating) subunit 1 [Candidatus Bilamarchaeum dharawalense]